MNPGDKIKVKTKDEEITGIVMPSSEDKKDFLIIKLDSGYNIGIEKKKIIETKVIEKIQKTMPDKKQKLYHNPELKTITILHTGGTIASKVDYKTGGVISRFTPEEILEMFPELAKIANIKSRLISNMWSDDMRFAHYNIIAKEIEKEIHEGTDGIIITHGTDTLHYTSAALSFMLENLHVPIILVGAQRSSDRGSSDAGVNLICAARFIEKTDFAGVAICMHENAEDKDCVILPGLKTRKMHSSRRDAFKAINSSAIAKINYDFGDVEFLQKDYAKAEKHKKTKVLPIKEDIKVGLLKIHTSMHAQEFLAYNGFEGLIIEGTGLGHMPITQIDEVTKEHGKIFSTIKELVHSGTIVTVAPQTIYGRINLNVYAPGRELQNIGVLGNMLDMHPETAFIKLAWLLSNYPKEEVKELYGKNLKGEITERTEAEEF